MSHDLCDNFQPIEGPSASLVLAKHIARRQQSPTAWFESGARNKHVASSDRTYHEVLVLMEALQRFGGQSAGLETFMRRALILMEAHDCFRERPDYNLAPYLAGAAASSDPMPRDLRSWSARRAKDKAETERYRMRARGVAEEAREEESGTEGVDVAEVVGRPSWALAPPPGHDKALIVGRKATDAPRGLAFDRLGPRKLETGSASLRPVQRYAKENWQTCQVATPPTCDARDPRLDTRRGVPPWVVPLRS